MNKEIQELLDVKPNEIQELFTKVERILRECTNEPLEEKLWARMPSYYLRECFVRIIPFNDHLNIEAKGIVRNAKLFPDYKITPKGMLQIFVNQDLPEEELKIAFYETLISD